MPSGRRLVDETLKYRLYCSQCCSHYRALQQQQPLTPGRGYAFPCISCNDVARIPDTPVFFCSFHTNEGGLPVLTAVLAISCVHCLLAFLRGDKVEAMAQLGGLICLQEPCSDGKGTFFFAGVDGVS